MVGNIPGGKQDADQRAQIQIGHERGAAQEERVNHTLSSSDSARGKGEAELQHTVREWREDGGESDHSLKGGGGIGHCRPKHKEFHNVGTGGMEQLLPLPVWV